MKKKYITPTSKVHEVFVPKLLIGSGESGEIEEGGSGGDGHGTLPSNSMEADFEE